jgi:hypothetical protein
LKGDADLFEVDREVVPVSLDGKESLEFAKKILEEAVQHQLDENAAFPRDVDKDKLQEWLVAVRKLYSPE